MVWKHTVYHVIKSDLGHARSGQEIKIYKEKSYTNPSKNGDKKEKRKRRMAIALQANAKIHWHEKYLVIMWN